MLTTISYLYAKFFKKYLRGKAIKNCSIDKTAVINSGSQFTNSKIGRYSYIGYDCDINNTNIGDFCSIANNVIIGVDQHPMNWVSTSPVFEAVKNSGPKKRFAKHKVPNSQETIIESDVWIGRNVIIMGGIKIGVGSVIGSGAIVTKDLEPYGIYAGVPAKLLRYRFDEEIIVQLLKSQWWTFSEDKIQDMADTIPSPELFIERLHIKT